MTCRSAAGLPWCGEAVDRRVGLALLVSNGHQVSSARGRSVRMSYGYDEGTRPVGGVQFFPSSAPYWDPLNLSKNGDEATLYKYQVRGHTPEGDGSERRGGNAAESAVSA